MINDISQAYQRIKHHTKTWWAVARDQRFFKYFRKQLFPNQLIPALMVMGYFGYIPLFFPLLLLTGVPYVVIKRHAIVASLKATFKKIVNFQKNLQKNGKAFKKLSEKEQAEQVNRYLGYIWRGAKHIIPVYLFFSFSFATAFLAIYGYYHKDKGKWFDFFKNLTAQLYRRFNQPRAGEEGDVPAPARQSANVAAQITAKRILLGAGLFLSASALYLTGFIGFFPTLLSYTLDAVLCTTAAFGLWVFAKDTIYAFLHPLRSLTLHTGVYLGALAGRASAYLLSTGRIQGTLPRFIGHIQTTGAFSALASIFVDVAQETARFGSFSSAPLFSDLRDFIGLFRGQYGVMGAEVYGIAGPTTAQLLFYTSFGAMHGWLAHRFFKFTYGVVKHDISNAADNYHDFSDSARFQHYKQRISDALYQHRWALTWVAGGLLYTLASPLTPLVLPFLGGSMLLATPLSCMILMGSAWLGGRYYARIEQRVTPEIERLHAFIDADPTPAAQHFAAHVGVAPVLPNFALNQQRQQQEPMMPISGMHPPMAPGMPERLVV